MRVIFDGRQRSIAGSCVIAALIGMSSSNAHAATFYTCTTSQTNQMTQRTNTTSAAKWSSNPQFRISSTDFPSGSALRTGITWAISEWNKGPQNRSMSSSFGSVVKNFQDTQSDIYIDDTIFTSCAGGAIGCATIFQSCSAGIISADIRFTTTPNLNDPNASWDSRGDGLYLAYHGVPTQDLRAVALHELGHALGLGHEANQYSIMGWSFNFAHANGISSSFIPGLFTSPYLGADTTNGARALYGTKSGSRPELSVSHWLFWQAGTGQRAGTSRHRFARVFDQGTLNVRPRRSYIVPCGADAAGNSETVCGYDVRRGQTVDFEITVENNGGASATGVASRVVLSSDVTIAMNDPVLDTPVLSFALASPQRRVLRVTIPTNLTLNRFYFLGVIADPNNTVAEIQEDPFGNTAPPAYTGNATWIPVYITN